MNKKNELMYDENASQLFYKIFRNKLLKKKIFYYLRDNIIGDKKVYTSIGSFKRDEKKGQFKSIFIGNIESSEEFIDFLKELKSDESESLTSLEFGFGSENEINIDLKDLEFPQSLKSLFLNKNSVKFIESKDSGGFKSIFKKVGKEVNNEKYPNLMKLNQISKLKLSEGSDLIIENGYYPQSLTSLKLNLKFKKPLSKGMIPEALSRLIISSAYNFSTIYIPPQLKYLSIGYNQYFYINQSILENLPSSITNLKLLFDPNENIKPFKPEIAKSLKKLVIVKDNSINSPLYLNGSNNLDSLTSLDLSLVSNYNLFNIGSLPQTLVKLRLHPGVKLTDPKGKGFPSSLTSLESDISKIMSKSFQNPSNIKSLSIYFLYDNNEEKQYSLNKFNNLKSLRYLSINSINRVLIDLPPPDSIENLEINSPLTCSRLLNLHQESLNANNFKNLNMVNVKSLRLSGYITNNIINSGYKFKESVELLDLGLSPLDEGEHIPEQSKSLIFFSFSQDNLPLNIQNLIIRGQPRVEATFVEPLPKTLDYIMISDNTRISQETTELFKKYIRFFNVSNDKPFYNYEKSKLYKKFTSYYENK